MPLPTGNLYNNYRIHGGFYRPILSLDTPWIPSPVVLPRELDEEDEASVVAMSPYPYYIDSSNSSNTASTPSSVKFPHVYHSPATTSPPPIDIQHTNVEKQPRKKRPWFSRVMKRLLRRRNSTSPIQVFPSPVSESTSNVISVQLPPTPAPSQVIQREPPRRRNRWPPVKLFTGCAGPFPRMNPGIERVPLSEWKAWGYYVLPSVDNIYVKNLPMNSGSRQQHPRHNDIHAMFRALRTPLYPGEDTEFGHPELWIPGQVHPALPPRPTRWKRVNPSKPSPFPWECQLNPILTFLDPRTHTPTIEWNINWPRYMGFWYKGPNSGHLVVRLCPPDFLQPATFPFLPQMYLNGLAYADDPEGPWARDHRLPWPVMVTYREDQEGVLISDVLLSIQMNFEIAVSRSEYDRWTPDVKERVKQAFIIRGRNGRRLKTDEEKLRYYNRADFLGPNVYLYGLRPNSNFEGWTLLMGPEPPQ